MLALALVPERVPVKMIVIRERLKIGCNVIIPTGPSATSPSRTDGSAGGGPSIAHRRDSYFDRTKDSILWSGGICPCLRCASQ